MTSSAGSVLAQRLEGAQQDRQPLALDGLADEGDAQRCAVASGRAAAGRGAGQVDPVGDDPVAPAVEAPARPGGGLGHGDAHVQPVELSPRARDHVAQAVGQRVLGVGVERADERGALEVEGAVAHDRRDGLVDVDDVEAARRELAAQRRDGARRGRERGHRAVHGQAERAPQRHQVVRHGTVLGPGTTMQPRRHAVVRVVGGEHADVVAEPVELTRQSLDVAHHAARVRPRVRRHEGDPHRRHPSFRLRWAPCGQPYLRSDHFPARAWARPAAGRRARRRSRPRERPRRTAAAPVPSRWTACRRSRRPARRSAPPARPGSPSSGA